MTKDKEFTVTYRDEFQTTVRAKSIELARNVINDGELVWKSINDFHEDYIEITDENGR
jgi:hypothetical protein